MKSTTLELGGNAPAIVFDDVNLESVVSQIAYRKFRNSGQVCTTPKWSPGQPLRHVRLAPNSIFYRSPIEIDGWAFSGLGNLLCSFSIASSA